VSRKLTRLLFVTAMVTGASAPMFGAHAAGQPRSVDAWNPPRNFEVVGKSEPTLDVYKGDVVSWNIMEGEHTVTPENPGKWGGDGGGDANNPLKAAAPRYSKTFNNPGEYIYFCSLHGGIDDAGKEYGMWGKIVVIDPSANNNPPPPPPPTPQPPTTQPTPPSTTAPARPGPTPPATTATVPTTRPAPSGPATTATTAKADKGKKAKDETTTTTTVPPLTPPPPPVDLPDEAIIPALPGPSTTSSAEPGATAEAPLSTPEGEAVALLKSKKSGDNAMKLLILSGVGLGALGIGTAGYKYANRSSKYFPA
jgi:plastocyanin